MEEQVIPNSYRFFANQQIYHVYNRGVNRQPTFTSRRDYQRAIQAIDFYRFSDSVSGLATYLKQPPVVQFQTREQQESSGSLVEILAYCLMPNHFHFLLRQTKEQGISLFLSQLQNSYTRYYNVAHQRSGPLFTGTFKAVPTVDQVQLLHVSRYIHLNPYSGHVVKSAEQLFTYSWSSFPEYIGKSPFHIVNMNPVLESFSSPRAYGEFVVNQADYQRQLAKIAHLSLEEVPML